MHIFVPNLLLMIFFYAMRGLQMKRNKRAQKNISFDDLKNCSRYRIT